MPTKADTRRAAVQRTLASKKWYDAAMLFESDTIVDRKKEDPQSPKSPTSIFAMSFVPEMQKLVLPGTWVEIGRKGRPLKQDPKAMYDEPVTKKKRKRSRTRKPEADETDEICKLEEAPSSSKCLSALDMTTMRHGKAASRGRALKGWIRHRAIKQIQRRDLEVLLATLDDDQGKQDDAHDTEDDLEPSQEATKLKQKKAFDPVGKARLANIRRAARFASAASKCYGPDNGGLVVFDEPKSRPAAMHKMSRATIVALAALETDLSVPAGKVGAADSKAEMSKKEMKPKVARQPFRKTNWMTTARDCSIS